ncbi:Vgb family protein [Novosphingobium clariflavum]|uniref:YncE family protein n=1 Tax=Novosphingobium clariflavum TaxID=2029884 RepID=A0ABV6SBH0_9SPHN|nr:YncE family protein [Novosphingobium clariflavum]
MRKFGLMALAAAGAFATISATAHAQQEQVIEVPGFADFLAVDGKTVWATNRGKVEQWSRDGKLAEVPMTRPCGAMAIAEGSLWVADCKEGAVKRIDVKTAKLLATIPTGIANPAGELNVVAGAGSIWVASDAAGRIARIDPATNAVASSVTVDPGTWYLSFGLGSLWAVSATQQTLQRIDPATNSVVGKVPLGKEPGFLAAGEGGVWVQEQGDGTVARIDPASVTVTGRIKVGANLKWGDIDTGGGKVWLRTTDDQVFVAIDPATMTVERRAGKAAGSGALRYTAEGLWTTAHDQHTLTWWPKSVLFGK